MCNHTNPRLKAKEEKRNVRAITRIPGLKAKEDKKARNHAGVSIGVDM